MSDQPIIIAGPTSVTIATQASVVVEDREVAWAAAKEQIQTRPDMGWLVGRYLCTDVANENGHTFRLADIETAYQRIIHTPLNMLHRATHVVGTYVAADLIRAEAMAASRDGETAHVEALAAVWRLPFPGEWDTITKANEEGTLYYSMEAIPKSVTCPTCAVTAKYAGPASDTYCEHMATAGGPKILDDPLFVGGAIVVPPARPGWRHADITELAWATEEQVDEIYDQLTGTGLSPVVAERLMTQLLAGAFAGVEYTPTQATRLVDAFAPGAKYTPAQRKKMIKEGVAMPDGSFPIPDKVALKRALTTLFFAKDKAKAKAHIIKRAQALGLTKMLPSAWKVKAAPAADILA